MATMYSHSGTRTIILVLLGILLAACGLGPATGAAGPPTPVSRPSPQATAPGAATSAAPTGSRPPAAAQWGEDRPRGQPTLLPPLKVEVVGTITTESQALRLPIALALDRQGQLYVLDAGTHRVLVFDDAGQFLRGWGSEGSDAGQFRWQGADCEDTRPPAPCPGVGGVAVDGQGDIYVADSGNHRVQVFDQRGHWVRGWGRLGAGIGEFRLPAGIAVDGQGHVYVSDTGNHRIQVFDQAGQFLTQWGGYGAGSGLLASPGALAVAAQGWVAVVDLGNSRVQQVDAAGRVLREWVTDRLISRARPETAIAVDRQGQLYVASASRVEQYSETGRLLTSWGRGEVWDIALVRLGGIAVADDGTVYIADRGAGRLLKVRQLLPTTS